MLLLVKYFSYTISKHSVRMYLLNVTSSCSNFLVGLELIDIILLKIY
jgi:hypothetical protein